MIVFKDIISGDEVMSDSYDMIEVDNVAYEVDCQMIIEGAVSVDTGANASAEEQEESLEDGAVTVNNVVNSFRLQQTSFDKKTYLSHLKGYMKKVKEHIKSKGGSDEEVTAFEKKAQAFAKKIVGQFKDFEFYVGESMDPDGMVLLLNYRPDGTTPFFIIWKDGLSQEKV